jgi:CDP-glucose 4,6-dehydratase
LEGLVIKREFWAGKRVLVTGHTGFKGSWLTLWLKALGAEVTGYALAPSTNPSLWQLLGLEGEVASRIADVRDYPALSHKCEEARPDIVFHLAAQSLVRPSYEDPVSTYATNVMGTVHLLEAVRQTHSVRAVVNVTSDKCYEIRERDRGYRENDPMGGLDPYSSSKGCAELVTAAYRSSFFDKGNTALASVRAGNVVGGGDWGADRLVPDFVRAALHDAAVQIRNPKSTRPWQHVLEPLYGYLLLAEHLWVDGIAHAGGWNFGPADDDAVPVETVVSALASLWGAPARWVAAPGSHPHEAHFLKLDSSKAREWLQWKPQLGLQTALAWTVEWYRGCADGASAKKLCLKQIERYEELARR